MSHNICWVDELMCGNHHVMTAESCSVLFIIKGSGLTVIEELG
jgi:hypothetical protein